MRIGRKLVDYAVPLGIAATAFLNAHTISTLVGVHLAPPPPSSFEAAVPRPTLVATSRPDARALLERNPFEHGAIPVEREADASLCEGVKPLVVVGAEDPTIAFAALEVGGKRVLRRRGDEVGSMRVAHVGRESVWLEQGGKVCEARLFAPTAAPKPEVAPASPLPVTAPSTSPLAGKIERVSDTVLRVDRAAIDRLLDTPSELAQMRVVPDGRGVRLGPMKPGSSLALLGLEAGDRLEAVDGVEIGDTERMMAAYARLKSGNVERLRLRITRAGRPIELDYVVR